MINLSNNLLNTFSTRFDLGGLAVVPSWSVPVAR